MLTVNKRFSDDVDSSGIVGYVFNRSDFAPELSDDLEYSEILDLVRPVAEDHNIDIDPYCGGAGASFIKSPSIWVGRSRVLITQFYGFDI